MQTFRNILFIIALLSCALTIKAQKKDFVIITRGDTIYCKIKFPALSDFGYYKTDDVSEYEKLDPYQLNEYYIAQKNTLYKAVYEPVTKQLQFMEVVEKGEICLYKFLGKGWGPGITGTGGPGITKTGGPGITGTGGYYYYSAYYISKGTQDLQPFNLDKAGKAIFAQVIMDKKNVYDKYIADDKFRFKQVKSLIHLYNTGELLKE